MFDDCPVILQEFQPTFAIAGEPRIGILGSRRELLAVHTIWDARGEWSFSDIMGAEPLSTLGSSQYSSVTLILTVPWYRDIDNLQPSFLGENTGANGPESKQCLTGRKQLIDFTIATLEWLIRYEKRAYGSTSLETFARLDIGVMRDKNGEWRFFVSKFKRLPNGCLWATTENANTVIGPLADRLSSAVVAAIYDVGSMRHVKANWWTSCM